MKPRVLLVLAVLAAASAAGGQDHQTFEQDLALVRNTQLLRVGPLRFQPRFLIQDLGYDDNVYYARQETPVKDYSGLFALDLRGYLLLGRSLILTFVETPEVKLYARQKDLRTFSNNISARAKLRLFNALVLSGRYLYNNHFRRAYSEFEQQVRDIRKGYEGSLFLETSRGSSMGFIGSVDDYRYENVSSPETISWAMTINRRETTGAFELNLPVFSRSLAFARAGYTKYDFQFAESAWRDSHAEQVTAGMRFPLTGRARGSLAFGFKRFTPRDRSRKGFEGLTANSDIDLRTGRLRWRLRLLRDNRFSYWESALYYVDDEAAAGVSFYLTRFLRLDYDFSAGRLDYPEPFAITLPDIGPVFIDRLDRTRLHSFGLSVRLIRAIGLSFSYNILDWRSTVPGFKLDRSFLGLNLTYDF